MLLKGLAGLIGDLLTWSRFQFFGQVDQSVSTIDRSALCVSLQRTDKGSALTSMPDEGLNLFAARNVRYLRLLR